MKLIKLTSVALALMMAFSSAPILAEDTSPIPAQVNKLPITVTVNGEKGEVTDIHEGFIEEASNEKVYTEAFEASEITIPEGSKIKFLCAFGVTANNIQEYNHQKAEIALNVKGLNIGPGDEIYLMYRSPMAGPGPRWFQVKATFNEEGQLVADVPSNCPMALYKMVKEASAEVEIPPAAAQLPTPVAYIDGKVVESKELEADIKAVIENKAEVKKIFAANGFVDIPKNAEILCIADGDYSFTAEEAATKVAISFETGNLDVIEGDTVYVMHKMANGEWEVVKTTVKNGYIKVELSGLSPIAIFKILEDGKVIEVAKEEFEMVQEAMEETPTTPITSVRKVVRRSPNTGI